MSDMIDGFTAQKIKDFWMKDSNDLSTFNPHNLCRQYSESLLNELDALRKDLDEQCRLLGISGSKEARLLADIETLRKENADLKLRARAAEDVLFGYIKTEPYMNERSAKSVANEQIETRIRELRKQDGEK